LIIEKEEMMRSLLSVIFVFLFVAGCGDDDDKSTNGETDAGERSDEDSGSSSKISKNTKKTVGDKGGELKLEEMKVEIPEGALREDIEIGIKVVEPPVPFPDDYVQISDVYECTVMATSRVRLVFCGYSCIGNKFDIIGLRMHVPRDSKSKC
jgi:hypothetical protein